jgi:hypothetical protein
MKNTRSWSASPKEGGKMNDVQQDRDDEDTSRPEDSEYYQVWHAQHHEVPNEERKDGPPSPIPEQDR